MHVTIVIATYNRPDVLRVAIQSVLRQTYPHWKLIVIGDRCDARTEEAVNAYADERIAYINLPVRAGEQSGPNSVGIAWAQTEFLAFLNHDDLWLPDHLEYGVNVLRTHPADIFLGRGAFSSKSAQLADGRVKPTFDDLHPVRRDPQYSIGSATLTQFRLFEPSSAWILRTQTAKRIGYWKGRDEIHGITPLQDWIRRAWRQKAAFAVGDKLTTLAIRTHYQKRYVSPTGVYNRPSLEHVYINEYMQAHNAEQIRAFVLEDLAKASPNKIELMANLWRKVMANWKANRTATIEKVISHTARLLLAPAARLAYYRFGFDLFHFLYGLLYRFRGRTTSDTLRETVYLRTGEHIHKNYTIDAIVGMTLAALDAPDQLQAEA